jgi:Zn-dependent protease with chaperone function
MQPASSPNCPECQTPVVNPERGRPWCPSCEWNLAEFDPRGRLPFGWRLVIKPAYRRAFSQDKALYDEFSARRPDGRPRTAAHLFMVALSLAMALGTFVCALIGLVDVSEGGVMIFAGLGLILIALILRPRLGRLPKPARRLRREAAPTLYALVDRVAEAAGTPAPEFISIAFSYVTGTGRGGLFQRRYLTLGIPMWLVLEPEQKVALLGHEMGHFVNVGSNRSMLVQPALRTFSVLTDYTQFRESILQVGNRRKMNGFELLFRMVMRLVSTVFLLIHLGLAALGMRDMRRAEYLADGTAADVAGTDALVGLQERMLLLPRIANVVGYNAETKRSLQWLGLASQIHANRHEDVPMLGQATMRATSLWDEHPPLGLRLRMAKAWPAQKPKVELTAAESAAIDRELNDWYAAAHAAMLGARDFRG